MLERPKNLIKVPKPPPPLPVQPKPQPIDIFDPQYQTPKMYYNPDQCEKPGYKIKDIIHLIGNEATDKLLSEVNIIGSIDGDSIVYALDYIRWKLKEDGEE